MGENGQKPAKIYANFIKILTFTVITVKVEKKLQNRKKMHKLPEHRSTKNQKKINFYCNYSKS